VPRLPIPKPVSGGILLSYKCTSKCKHCMYACSPKWKADWINRDDAEKILAQFGRAFKKAHPLIFDRVGINLGLHFTGGEPFLNYRLLLELVKMARRLDIPSTFVETNCFWSIDDETTEEKLAGLRDAGLRGILISVNPFILEHVPFERTRRAIGVSREIFGENMMVYQEFFLQQFEALKIRDTLSFQQYLQRVGAASLQHVELIPMGRACYSLAHLFRKYPAERFFSESCMEELTRPWHVHADNYCNYMTGYCAGISLGDARDLDSILQGIELDDRPVIARLVSPKGVNGLYNFGVEEFGYTELEDGYVSKCHLCLDIRKHIAQQTDEFKELRPREFYLSL